MTTVEPQGGQDTGDFGVWMDSTAMDMRAYFEANRPLTLREKLFGRREYVESCVADNLMLGLLDIAVQAKAKREMDDGRVP